MSGNLDIDSLTLSLQARELGELRKKCDHLYSVATLNRIKHCEELLRLASVYIYCIDKLVGDDDSEGSFHKNLLLDLHDLTEQYSNE